jgi:hypothetical protein
MQMLSIHSTTQGWEAIPCLTQPSMHSGGLPPSQVGAFGGIPGGGLKFGTCHNAAAIVPTATMIDFYNGSGVDMACLGMAEVMSNGLSNGICQPCAVLTGAGMVLQWHLADPRLNVTEDWRALF